MNQYAHMLRKILTLFCGLLISSVLLSQGTTKKKAPIKYRLLLTSVQLEDVSPDEIAITLNAFNTGRNPIDFSQINSIPDEMEIKFEESFYRSNLSDFEDEITASLLNRNLNITNGKILRNLRFNLPGNDDLYKQLTKNRKKFSRTYAAKDKTKAPKVKYKTSNKKSTNTKSTFASKKKKTTDKKTEETIVKNTSKKPNTPSTNTPAAPSSNDVKKEMASKELEMKKEMEVKQPKTTSPKVEISDKPASDAEKIKESTKKETIATTEKKKNIFEKKKEEKFENEKAKSDSYKIEKAVELEDQKEILESLGASKNKEKKTKSQGGVAFDTRAGVEESKNSYAEKSVCPDMILEDLKIIKKTPKWITLEYTLKNVGKGPAYLDKSNQKIAMRAFLSSSENLTRGSLPLGGGFVTYKEGKDGALYPNKSFTGTLKLDIKKITRFTPFVVLNLDPFNVINECDKANNYGNVKVGK